MGESLRDLTTTAEVIDELGGVSAVAKLTSRSYGAAFNWRGFVRFPSDTFVVMQAALRERGCTAPIGLWGMVEPARPEEVRA